MARSIDVRAGLGAELRRLVRDPRTWPMQDRRRFRNLLLDAVSSDAMPMAELLLRAHDDGLLRMLPDRSASRAQWDAATARMASDLQVQRFVEPGVARFVAESWATALGPDPVPMAKVAVPRAPAAAPRQAPRTSATVATAQRAAASAQASTATGTALSVQANTLSKYLLIAMSVMSLVFIFLVSRQSFQRSAALELQATAARAKAVRAPDALPVPAPRDTSAAVRADAIASTPGSAAAPSTPPLVESPAARARQPVEVGAAPVRTTDDIVLTAGRIFEGRVLGIRQQTIVVKDEETGLDFEIAKNDVDRIVTREGRVMRFGDDNVPLIGDDDDLTPMSHAGRYRVRYAERWGTERDVCGDVARRWAPGADLEIRHLRAAPMMQLAFVGGQGFNAAVRSDGLFESGVAMSPLRGPDGSFVSTRLSGRVSRGGVLHGVARLSAVRQDGAVVCDLALTVRGERQP